MSEAPHKRFEGHVAWVTGAAGGIGRATALRFAAEGASVACFDVNDKGLAETVSQIEAAKGVAVAFNCDVSNPESVKSTTAAARERFGKLNHLANVAGILRSDPTLELSFENWAKVIGINLTGTFLMCQAALPFLLETKGSIVNTSSTAALGSHPWMAAYAASKGGVLSLTKSLSIEFIKRGVRVNAIIPGAIATNMHSQFRLPEGGDFELLKGAIPHIPYGTPECVAGTIAFLCSKDAAFIHGAELLVDGGAMS
ncbi:MAG: SDR family oxidoreductase [Polyangiaceae bacterium]